MIWKALAASQASNSKKYEVLHNDSQAHVVKINDSPRAGETQYGYVFFHKSVRTPGPVRYVNKVNICDASENNSYRRGILSEISQINKFRNVPLQGVKTWSTASDNTIEEALQMVIVSGMVAQNAFNIERSNIYVPLIIQTIADVLIARFAAENQILEKHHSLISSEVADSSHLQLLQIP